MNVEKYLLKHQKIIAKTFLNALKSEQLSHAYLLTGEQGTPLLQIAYFFVKTLLCDERPFDFACCSCLTCYRIDEDNYADLLVFDGSKGTIKKESIQEIESRFANTAIEEKGIMVYIIHLVENMTLEAINSLLKFLEEPGKNIYAFLTTENEFRVLPTIISRSQTLHFKSLDREELKNEAISLGVDAIDAELLVGFYNDAELIKMKSLEEEFLLAKQSLLDTLEALKLEEEKTILQLHLLILPRLKTKEATRFYLDMMQMAFEDILNIQNECNITLRGCVNILNDLSVKLSHVQASLLEIMTKRSQIDLNINLGLLIDHLIYFIYKGDEKNE